MEATEQQVLHELRRRNGADARFLADVLGIPTRTALAALRRLERRGEVKRRYRALAETTDWRIT